MYIGGLIMDINDKRLREKNIFCNGCEKLFSLSEIELKSIGVDSANVRYYKCPICGYLYIVGVDTNDTRALQKKIERFIKRLECFRKNGKEPPDDLIKSLEKERDKLFKMQEALIKKYKTKLPGNL